MSSPAEDCARCPRCASALKAWHCRMLCPECGYQADCSDVGLPD